MPQANLFGECEIYFDIASTVSAFNGFGPRFEVTVRLPGGQLMVSWRGAAEPVWLTGNAELISEGTIDL